MEAHTRLVELGAEEVDEYVDSVRRRLECAGPSEPVPCAASRTMPPAAPWARSRGHNAVTALVHAAAQSCDHTAGPEVPGLLAPTSGPPTF